MQVTCPSIGGVLGKELADTCCISACNQCFTHVKVAGIVRGANQPNEGKKMEINTETATLAAALVSAAAATWAAIGTWNQNRLIKAQNKRLIPIFEPYIDRRESPLGPGWHEIRVKITNPSEATVVVTNIVSLSRGLQLFPFKEGSITDGSGGSIVKPDLNPEGRKAVKPSSDTIGPRNNAAHIYVFAKGKGRLSGKLRFEFHYKDRANEVMKQTIAI
ncbi:MAG: hypothetical protein EpisKO_15700 [Epibacterium sp.]